MSEMITALHRHRRLDGRVTLVTYQLKVIEAVIEDGFNRGVEVHVR